MADGLQPGHTFTIGGTNTELNALTAVTGTKTPGQLKAEAAANAYKAGGTNPDKTLLPGGLTPKMESGAQASAPLYTSESAANYWAKLTPKEREKTQRLLMSVGAYGQNYTPTYGYYGAEDINAFNKLAIIGEQIGKADIRDVVTEVKKDPKLINLVTTGGTTTGQKTVTSASEAAATLNDQFLNVFNSKPTKAEVTAYTNALNAKERSSKTGLSNQERQDILLGVMNQRATSLANAAQAGNKTAQTQLSDGILGRYVRDIRGAYADNGVPIDDNTVLKQATAALRSQDAYNNVMSTIQVNAKAMFPALSQYIDQGKTVKDILNPYIQLRSQILEQPVSQIKVSDLQDVASGQSLMTTNDYKKTLYSDPAWKKTNNYMQTTLGDARALLQQFGLGA